MELVIDVKIEVKSSSYRNVITDFGYFKKITGESVSETRSFLCNGAFIGLSVESLT